MTSTGTRRRCFVSAPAGAPVGQIVAALGRGGWDPYVLTDVVNLGDSAGSAVLEAIRASDAVIAVLPDARSIINVAFEAGMASALGKPLLLVASPNVRLPSDLSEVPIIRAEPNNTEAIEFALGLLKRDRPRPARSHTGTPIGKDISVGLLSQASTIASETDAVGLLAEALRASGAIVAPASTQDWGYDLGVWSDDLAAIGATPLLIELKRHLDERARLQLQDGLRLSKTARVGLLVHLEPAESPSGVGPLSILSIGLVELLARLSEESFAQIILDLRNRAAHSRS